MLRAGSGFTRGGADDTCAHAGNVRGRAAYGGTAPAIVRTCRAIAGTHPSLARSRGDNGSPPEIEIRAGADDGGVKAGDARGDRGDGHAMMGDARSPRYIRPHRPRHSGTHVCGLCWEPSGAERRCIDAQPHPDLSLAGE